MLTVPQKYLPKHIIQILSSLQKDERVLVAHVLYSEADINYSNKNLVPILQDRVQIQGQNLALKN